MKLSKIALLTFAPFLLGSCNHYVSHYKAQILITSNANGVGKIYFDKFEGTYVFKLRKISDGEGAIYYQASLKEGHIDVKYNFLNFESPLFSINSNESLNDKGGYIEKGHQVIIVLTSEGAAYKGDFTFDLN